MMSTRERLFQAIIFELLLILLIVPVVYILGAQGSPISPEKAVITGVVGSMNALLLNYFYNLAFDRHFGTVRIERTQLLRIAHAIGFELALLITYLPFLMWYLSIGFFAALLLDIVLMGMALLYTYLFHLIYDHARHRAVSKMKTSKAVSRGNH